MEITYLGYACFRLKGSHGIVIIDPYPPTLGYNLGKPVARIVTVSHGHPNHSYAQGVTGDFRTVTRPGEYEIGDMLLHGLATFHDAEQGLERGKNTVFTIVTDALSICHLGDLGHPLNPQQIEELENVDILLIPVGGVATINAIAAVEIVRKLEPKIVIPMHYKTPEINQELQPLEDFLKEMGGAPVIPQPKLVVTKSSLPLTMQVVVLDYPH